MKNEKVTRNEIKIESVAEYLDRGGKIKIAPTSRRNRSRITARHKLYNRRKYSPRTQSHPNPIY